MRDLSHLPAPEEPAAERPTQQARFAPTLAEAWLKINGRDDDKPHAFPDTRIRHSQAGDCARNISYKVMGAAETEPFTIADIWRLGTGTIIHERWQDAMRVAFPDAEVEVKVRLDECQSSGHIDLVLTEEMITSRPGFTENQWKTAMELKTINGFGFKKSIGIGGKAEGPRHSAFVQGALNAKAVNADELVIVYLSLENVSPGMLKKGGFTEEWERFAAEWTYSREVYEPVADQEIARFQRILADVDEGKVVPRAIPDPEIPRGARVTDPVKGTWQQMQDGQIVNVGRTWRCDYCSFRTRCIEDGE